MSLEDDYKKLVARPYLEFQNKINKIDSKEIKVFLNTVLDASEILLRDLLSQSPSEIDFSKDVTTKDINVWFLKVSQAFISYSYYFYSDSPSIKNSDTKDLVEKSYKMWWKVIFSNYKIVFGQSINMNTINYYAAGLKEDSEKKYSATNNMEMAMELNKKDAIIIATELIESMWNEKMTQGVKTEIKNYKIGHYSELSQQAKKVLFVGARIWQVYQQIIQPFLGRLLI